MTNIILMFLLCVTCFCVSLLLGISLMKKKLTNVEYTLDDYKTRLDRILNSINLKNSELYRLRNQTDKLETALQ